MKLAIYLGSTGITKGSTMDLKTLKEIEREHLLTVLEKTGWNIEKASRLLKISVSQVKRKIQTHGLMPPESS
ncbi:MAG: helix-turn-helix domain-containing protein [Deltaproteobacteria bacterium]|nr:helix-turn-helix domain-containing protein [Deltaproteobacteria bacterium]